MPDNSMSRAAFARVMGVHKSQVTRWVEGGMPSNKDGSINPDTGSQWVHLNVDPAKRNAEARRHAHAVAMEAKKGPKGPPCTDHLNNDVDRGIMAALPGLMYRFPHGIPGLAVACGASLPVAYAIYKAMWHSAALDTADMLDALDVPPPPGHDSWNGAPFIQPELFEEVNWPNLAGLAGVPLDVEAWEANARKLLSDPDEQAAGAVPL